MDPSTVAVTGSHIVGMTRKGKYERVISNKGASPHLSPVFCLFLFLLFVFVFFFFFVFTRSQFRGPDYLGARSRLLALKKRVSCYKDQIKLEIGR